MHFDEVAKKAEDVRNPFHVNTEQKKSKPLNEKQKKSRMRTLETASLTIIFFVIPATENQ